MSETRVAGRQIAPALSTRVFVRHFVEMVIAMLVGMFVLGTAVSMVFAALGHPSLLHFAGLRALFMTGYMIVGMAAWMRYRRHSWERIGEMSAAMVVPLAVLIGPFLLGAISAWALLVAMHILMVPLMLAAMLLRREEYSRPHQAGRAPISAT